MVIRGEIRAYIQERSEGNPREIRVEIQGEFRAEIRGEIWACIRGRSEGDPREIRRRSESRSESRSETKSESSSKRNIRSLTETLNSPLLRYPDDIIARDCRNVFSNSTVQLEKRCQGWETRVTLGWNSYTPVFVPSVLRSRSRGLYIFPSRTNVRVNYAANELFTADVALVGGT